MSFARRAGSRTFNAKLNDTVVAWPAGPRRTAPRIAVASVGGGEGAARKAQPRGWGSRSWKVRRPPGPARRPDLNPGGFSRKASFPDLSFERQVKTKLAVRVEGTGLVQAVDVQGRVARAGGPEPGQAFRHQPGGQAPSPVLRHSPDRAHQADRLRPRVLDIGLELAERHSRRLAGGGRHGHQAQLWSFACHQLVLGARRKAPMVRKGTVVHVRPRSCLLYTSDAAD